MQKLAQERVHRNNTQKKFGSWFGHVLWLEHSAEFFDSNESGSNKPQHINHIITYVWFWGSIYWSKGLGGPSGWDSYPCGNNDVHNTMSTGGITTPEHTEALRNEKDKLKFLDSQYNSQSEGWRAPVMDLKAFISCSFRANLAENHNKFYFCMF